MNPYSFFKFLAFKMDAEKAHERSFRVLRHFPLACSEVFHQSQISNKYGQKISGINWTFPIGLAAGLDKNAEAIPFFSRLYFGAIEVGTVTPRPQSGNEKPRLFRLVEEESLLNRMGFNNLGSEIVYQHLKHFRDHRTKPIGVNIGKNKDTPDEKSIDDYLFLYDKFAGIADYLVINISSPNTPGLRDLQSVKFLKELFFELKDLREKQSCPLFVKLSPDIDFDDLSALLSLIADSGIEGIIATNTTIMPEKGQGGVSGKLLSSKAEEFRNKILAFYGPNSTLEVIGVGGISQYQDLKNFWAHGGKVVQIYSSFIYQGPKVLEKIKYGIDKDMESFGVATVDDLRKVILQG